ncbi:MAG: glycosyltransferase family 4 protein [Proteobacteria bacterium]|nr:glycosyltransferase family 4 protein [Pseudomonadota bacterium]
MKILFINPYYPPWAPGGAEHSLEQMCIQFSRNGWDVEVLAVAFDKRGLDEARSGYWIRWIHAPFLIKPGQNVDAEQYFRTNNYRKAILDRFSGLDQPDVIIANNAQSYAIVDCLSRKNRIPSIGIVRDTQMLCDFGVCMDNRSATEAVPCNGFLGAASCSISFHRKRGAIGWRPVPAWGVYGFQMHRRRLKLRSTVQKFDHIVTISDSLKMLVQKALPFLKSDHITTIRNFYTQVKPVDKGQVTNFLNHHGLASRHFFLFAGRKTYGKGADLLVSATDIVQSKSSGYKSLLLGRGKLPSAIGTNCVDSESISQDLLLGVLEQATALVIPGRWQEGLHRTMIDAIKFGIPVICTQAGAPSIDGVEHGKNGLVCCCDDPVALATSMIEIINWNEEKLDQCRFESDRIFQKRFASDINIDHWSRVLYKSIT